MIKINLLHQNQPKGPSAGEPLSQMDTEDSQYQKEVQKQFLIRVLVVIMAPVGLYLYESNIMSGLRARQSSLQPQIAELAEFNSKAAEIKAEVEKFKEDEAKIQMRIQALNSLSRQRLNEIKILDFIQQVIPEKVWLSELDFKGGEILMVGYAASNDEISKFQEVLTKSAFLKNVNLASSKELVVETVPLKQFSITSLVEQAR